MIRRLAWIGAIATTAAAATPPSSPQLVEAGKAAYEQTCAACHGLSGEGNGPVAFALKPPPRNFTKDPFKAGDSVEQIFATVTGGLAGTTMVGFPKLAERDRWALAYYIRAFRPKK